MNIVAIFIGGGLGSLCRYGIGKLTASYLTSSFAYATLFSNVLSTLILASLVSVEALVPFPPLVLRLLKCLKTGKASWQ